MSIYKPSLLDKFKDFVNGLKSNWDAFESHQAESANQAHGGFKGAKIGLSSNVSLTTNAQISISWNTIDYDDSGFFTLSTPTRLTIPNGVSKVRLIVALQFASNADGARAIYLQKNNSSFLASSQRASTNITTRMQLVTPVLLVQEGDYFNVLAQQFSGTTLDLLSSGDTYFSLEVVE